jgi:hypothetical protein
MMMDYTPDTTYNQFKFYIKYWVCPFCNFRNDHHRSICECGASASQDGNAITRNETRKIMEYWHS